MSTRENRFCFVADITEQAAMIISMRLRNTKINDELKVLFLLCFLDNADQPMRIGGARNITAKEDLPVRDRCPGRGKNVASRDAVRRNA